MRRLKTLRRPPIYPKTPGHLPCSSLTHPLPLPSRRPSVSFGGFGLKQRPRMETSNATIPMLDRVLSISEDTPYHSKLATPRGQELSIEGDTVFHLANGRLTFQFFFDSEEPYTAGY